MMKGVIDIDGLPVRNYRLIPTEPRAGQKIERCSWVGVRTLNPAECEDEGDGEEGENVAGARMALLLILLR